MVPDSEANTGSEQAQGSSATSPVRRGRRSGRGRRGGRGRRRPQQPPRPEELPSTEAAVEPSPQTSETKQGEPKITTTQHFEWEGKAHAPTRQQHGKSAPASSLQTAIDEVNNIVETLRESLEDMEEVLETLEFVERQKNADEQEVETLRRQLRQLWRPREEVSHSHREIPSSS